MSRDQAKHAFLRQCGWEGAAVEKIPGDASFRNYERLTLGDESRILMDAPPPKEEVTPFITVAKLLREKGLNAPEIFAANTEDGFLLLEDFGNHSYSKVLLGKTALQQDYSELTLYQYAIDALVTLHKSPSPETLPLYSHDMLIEESMLMLEWYYPILNGEKLPQKLQDEFIAIWRGILPDAHMLPSVMVLRDYHADNLMWLPDRQSIQRVGQLDFQDAVIGSPAYDLVSLLEDLRRDVQPATVDSVINRYLQARPEISRKDFLAAYAILGAQRNCKIVGFCARKSLRDNNPAYLPLLPRVWKHIEHDLSHPLLLPLKEWFRKVGSSYASGLGNSARA